jgi:signal transduction histidine kinase
MLALGAVVLVAVAIWMRNPAIGVGRARAPAAADAAARLRRDLSDEARRLAELAEKSLSSPPDAGAAFAFLGGIGAEPNAESVVLFDSAGPLAWTGHPRMRVDSLSAPMSVTADAFFVVLHVSKSRGARRAVASDVVFAAPPASRLVNALASKSDMEAGLRLELPGADTSRDSSRAVAEPVLAAAGHTLLLASAGIESSDELRFRLSARTRAQWAVSLLVGFLLFLVAGWRDRHDVLARLFSLGVGVMLTGIVPWNAFSNSSRAFDPGFYFSRLGGPYTANAAALLSTVVLLLMAVFAVSRARPRIVLPRSAAAVLAVVILGAGVILGSNIVRGVGQPSWGSTPGLWLSWELPLFLFLFAVAVGAASLTRIAFRKPGMLPLSVILSAAFVAAIIATSALWLTTTRQRMRLAERDVAALTRVDESEDVLLERFISMLSSAGAPRSSGELLRAYASSELSAAEFPVVLETRSAVGAPVARLDLAPDATDSAGISYASRAAGDSSTVTSILGPTGVQALGRAIHPGGEITTIVVLPHTRLIAPPPFALLFGLGQHPSGDPPYTVTLTDVSATVPANARLVRWERIGDQWHGDRLVPTSAGTRRAHVEIDLRSFAARGERAVLIVLLDILLAGLLWFAGATTERPFRRWLRARAASWMRTYRARLTLALFAFFVIPAIAFALWSYQRLRSDDRQTRELLVNETLQTVASGATSTGLAEAGTRFDTPLFRYGAGFLNAASDSLYASLAPGGIALPPPVELDIGGRGELTASAQERIADSDVLLGYRAILGPNEERYVLAAPARGDDLVLDRRRRDLGILVLFSTAVGALAALVLSGMAAKTLARDLELSRIEVARAERVIAWGEMARQVAHEIKNPLTPIRLGVQHLRRARKDNRPDFDRVLDDNVTRILAEIDRLDSVASAFSRYGSAPADLLPAERIDVSAVVRDVVALEQMGKGEVKWKVRGAEEKLLAMARAEELREVVLNVLENARLAGARRVEIALRQEERRVTIETIDDGSGISAASLPRIFEPHFSTRTTGSGFGLAASRKIIEQWGGEIAITSEEGKGARVLIALVRPVG